MKILYHHRTRGTDAQRVHITEMVHAFRALGHSVEVVALANIETPWQDAKRDAEDAPWKNAIRRIPFGYEAVQLAYNFIGLPLLLWKLLNHKVDFIYERYSLFNFSGVVAARLCRIPIVLEVNSAFALEQQRDREIRAFGLARWSERFGCNLATKVIVVSTPLRRIMTNAGVAPEKLVVMSNGVNLERFRRQDIGGLRTPMGLEAKIVIGFVGWFRNWHGLGLLLEAFHKSRLADRDAVILLIGDGPAMPELQEYTDKHGLRNSVIFTGPLPHGEVPPYLDLIDIAVQPAANEYCCPMKILEYMALGKPIVAPRQENIQELLKEGSEGELFTPGDSTDLGRVMASLVSDRERARLLGARAREVIYERGYLWSKNAERVVELVRGAPAQWPATKSEETFASPCHWDQVEGSSPRLGK